MAPAPLSKESLTSGMGRKNLTAVVENPEDSLGFSHILIFFLGGCGGALVESKGLGMLASQFTPQFGVSVCV